MQLCIKKEDLGKELFGEGRHGWSDQPLEVLNSISQRMFPSWDMEHIVISVMVVFGPTADSSYDQVADGDVVTGVNPVLLAARRAAAEFNGEMGDGEEVRVLEDPIAVHYDEGVDELMFVFGAS